jgi:membrane associated rhomboid family serine protease
MDADAPPDWVVVYQDGGPRGCSERALVLDSLGIAYRIVADQRGRHALLVPSDEAEKAKFQLWAYEQENQPVTQAATFVKPDYEQAVPGIIAYFIVILAVAYMDGNASFAQDWRGAGRVDGMLVRGGEWWRLVTALTLHSGLKHILGNLVFGLLFGLVAGGLLGSGVAWLAIVIAGGLGNGLNVYLLDAAHRSIGASTAVFAALGLVSGFVWRARLMAQDRWAWRLGPIVGGIALLAYTGTGDANTDVGAHLAGFVCGFAGGMVLSRIPPIRGMRRVQRICGVTALILVALAWLLALLAWDSAVL